MPSGAAASPRWAQTRRLARLPSGVMSNAVSTCAYDSATINVESSGRHGHPVGEAEPVRHLADRAVGGGQGGQPRPELSAGEVERDVVEVGVAATVHRDLVPLLHVERATEIGVGDQGAVRLLANDAAGGSRDEQQPTVGEPVDANRDEATATRAAGASPHCSRPGRPR